MQAKKIVISGAMILGLLFGFGLPASAETLDEIMAEFEAGKSEADIKRDKAWNLARAHRRIGYAEQKIVNAARNEAILAEVKIQNSKPSPKIGMNKSKVINGTNWGAPTNINTTINANGTHEQWVYRSYSGWGSDRHVSSTRYLNFTNDKLTSIQY